MIRKYFEFPEGRKEWIITGEYGSLSFWVREQSPFIREKFGDQYFGGVETHYNEKSKPDYLDDNSLHDICHANNDKCWHDGTSLWASEHWIPYILPHGNERIWLELELNYKDMLEPREE